MCVECVLRGSFFLGHLYPIAEQFFLVWEEVYKNQWIGIGGGLVSARVQWLIARSRYCPGPQSVIELDTAPSIAAQ